MGRIPRLRPVDICHRKTVDFKVQRCVPKNCSRQGRPAGAGRLARKDASVTLRGKRIARVRRSGWRTVGERRVPTKKPALIARG